MEVQEAKGEVFKALIQEFKKPTPDGESIEKFMGQLNLEYQSDDFANMEQVLRAMSFQAQRLDIQD